jgi:hypothetical protein
MSDVETLPELDRPRADPVVLPAPEQPVLDDGDHDRFAHYVRKDKVVASTVNGTALRALCGKKWVPSRDPSKFPVCPECKAVYDKLKKGGDDGDGDGGDSQG